MPETFEMVSIYSVFLQNTTVAEGYMYLHVFSAILPSSAYIQSQKTQVGSLVIFATFVSKTWWPLVPVTTGVKKALQWPVSDQTTLSDFV